MISLYTERLFIRDHVESDLETHHKLLSDEIPMRYLPDIRTSSSEESQENLLQAISDSTNENRKYYFLRIEDRLTGEHIGEAGYTITKYTPFGKFADLGYFIRQKHWNKGYTTEAVKRIIQFAFENDNVYRISTGCLAENCASERVMQKCGMIKEGELKDYTLHEGKLKDRVIYRLLRTEWDKILQDIQLST
jgi:ribosomal-protein-alanine N-acetyltransferase